MSTIKVNANDLINMIRSRQDVAGYGSLDGKRPDAWLVYGYRDVVTFDMMMTAYSRGGAGHGAIHRLLDGCWQSLPRIKSPSTDEVTPWEKKLNKMLKGIRAWAKFRDFDRRNMVGRYSALIYRAADNKQLNEPLERATALVDLIPIYEDQIKVTAWVTDANSDQYGRPAMHQYRSRRPDISDTQDAPEQWVDVHPSRVQILAEGSVGDMFDGVPLLQAGINNLADIEKISGGSAESFLKNSARTMTFEYAVDANPSAIGADGKPVDVKEAHETQVRHLNQNIDSAIVTQGAKANVLQTHVSDPTGAFQLAANLFSASVQIPFTVLFGQQTGRLASDEDKADMQARCKSRQNNELTPMLEEFVSRMQVAGIIESGDFEIEWPDISAPSDRQKLGNAKEMAAINSESYKVGMAGELPFTGVEIRKVAGWNETAPQK